MQRLLERLRASPALERVIEVGDAARACPDGEGFDALLCHTIPSGTGAAIYAVPRAGAFFDPGYTEGFGTSHGSPFLYDRSIPLFVRRPGITPGGRAVAGVLSFTRFYREAAAALGLQDPITSP